MASNVLRNYIRGLLVEASPISANYQNREDIRAHIQEQIVSLVESGEIATQDDVESFLMDYKSTVDMAVNALKMVPITSFSRSKTDLEKRQTSKKSKKAQ